MTRWALVIVCVMGCKDKPATAVASDPDPVPPTHEITGPFKKGDDVAVTAPAAVSHADWIAPAKPVAWSKPTRTRNSQEETLYGTWVAKVGDYGTRSAYMADRVMYAFDGSGKTVVENVMSALANDNKVATSCIWLELRPDFTGIRRECAIINGEPSALDETDIATGLKKDLGTRFEWYIDEQDRNTIKIHFAADMVVPAIRDGKLRTLVFRTWNLQFAGTAGDNTFTMTESFPEHGYTLPTKYPYQISSHSFLDQK